MGWCHIKKLAVDGYCYTRIFQDISNAIGSLLVNRDAGEELEAIAEEHDAIQTRVSHKPEQSSSISSIQSSTMFTNSPLMSPKASKQGVMDEDAGSNQHQVIRYANEWGIELEPLPSILDSHANGAVRIKSKKKAAYVFNSNETDRGYSPYVIYRKLCILCLHYILTYYRNSDAISVGNISFKSKFSRGSKATSKLPGMKSRAASVYSGRASDIKVREEEVEKQVSKPLLVVRPPTPEEKVSFIGIIHICTTHKHTTCIHTCLYMLHTYVHTSNTHTYTLTNTVIFL